MDRARPRQSAAHFLVEAEVDDRRAEQALRFRARVTSVIGLGEEVSSISATVRAEIQQGLARELSLPFPRAS